MGGIHFSCLLGCLTHVLVWYLLVLPSQIHAVANLASLRKIDGDTSYHSHKSFSLMGIQLGVGKIYKLGKISVWFLSCNHSILLSESMRQEGDIVIGDQRFPRQSVRREQEEDSPLLLSGLQEGLHKEFASKGPPAHSHRHVLYINTVVIC